MDKLQRLKRRSLVTGFLLLLLFFTGFTSGGRQSLFFVERFLGDVFSPVVQGVAKTANAVASGVDTIIHLPGLVKENKKLKEDVARLEGENRNLNDIISRTDYLRNEARLLNNTTYDLVKAAVIGKDPGNYFSHFVIDGGRSKGMKKDDTVVVGVDGQNGVILEGVVGKITEVGDNWANVDAIFNEGNAVAFRNIRTQDGGVLQGAGEGKLKGFSYDPYGDIVTNDRLITSGIGDLYSGELFIGTVLSVHRDEEAQVQELEVAPAVNFQKLYQVYVIKGKK